MVGAGLESRKQIYGVDFSGAKDAGRKVWIAKGEIIDKHLYIDKCSRITEFIGVNKELDATLNGLTELISSQTDAIFGLDFPFSVPGALMKTDTNWSDFVKRFPGMFPTAEVFKDKCIIASDGWELKRCTENESSAPMSAYNLRLYKQTYHGICRVLFSLVDNEAAVILPMGLPMPGKPWVVEVCPRSTIKTRFRSYGLVDYKQTGETQKHERFQLIDWIKAQKVTISEDLIDKIIADGQGDAIDSVIAAVAVWLNFDILVKVTDKLREQEPYCREGYIFV